MQKLSKNLKELGFNANEIRVYLALTQLGEARASKIAKKCELSRTTVISILERLAKESFVTTHSFHGTTYYWIESPNTITEIFENKVKIAQDLGTILSSLYRSDAVFPTANIYDTKKGIKKFTESILAKMEKNSIIYTIDSPHMGNYLKVLSSEYNDLLVSMKQKKAIQTLTLIPDGSYSKINLEKIVDQKIKIKEMPKGIDFPASVWFIGDLCVLFSGKPPFIVSIQHELINKSLKSIFDYFWSISELKFCPK